MSDARRYAVWPEPRSRSRSLKEVDRQSPTGLIFNMKHSPTKWICLLILSYSLTTNLLCVSLFASYIAWQFYGIVSRIMDIQLSFLSLFPFWCTLYHADDDTCLTVIFEDNPGVHRYHNVSILDDWDGGDNRSHRMCKLQSNCHQQTNT